MALQKRSIRIAMMLVLATSCIVQPLLRGAQEQAAPNQLTTYEKITQSAKDFYAQHKKKIWGLGTIAAAVAVAGLYRTYVMSNNGHKTTPEAPQRQQTEEVPTPEQEPTLTLGELDVRQAQRKPKLERLRQQRNNAYETENKEMKQLSDRKEISTTRTKSFM